MSASAPATGSTTRSAAGTKYASRGVASHRPVQLAAQRRDELDVSQRPHSHEGRAAFGRPPLLSFAFSERPAGAASEAREPGGRRPTNPVHTGRKTMRDDGGRDDAKPIATTGRATCGAAAGSSTTTPRHMNGTAGQHVEDELAPPDREPRQEHRRVAAERDGVLPHRSARRSATAATGSSSRNPHQSAGLPSATILRSTCRSRDLEVLGSGGAAAARSTGAEFSGWTSRCPCWYRSIASWSVRKSWMANPCWIEERAVAQQVHSERHEQRTTATSGRRSVASSGATAARSPVNAQTAHERRRERQARTRRTISSRRRHRTRRPPRGGTASRRARSIPAHRPAVAGRSIRSPIEHQEQHRRR